MEKSHKSQPPGRGGTCARPTGVSAGGCPGHGFLLTVHGKQLHFLLPLGRDDGGGREVREQLGSSLPTCLPPPLSSVASGRPLLWLTLGLCWGMGTWAPGGLAVTQPKAEVAQQGLPHPGGAHADLLPRGGAQLFVSCQVALDKPFLPGISWLPAGLPFHSLC